MVVKTPSEKKRIITRFKKELSSIGINVQKHDHRLLYAYLIKKFNDRQLTRVTSVFVMEALNQFKIRHPNLEHSLAIERRPLRPKETTENNEKTPLIRKKRGNLINIATRPGESEFNYQPHSKSLTPNSKKELSEVGVSFSPIQKLPGNEDETPLAKNRKGEVYRRIIETSSGELYRKASPASDKIEFPKTAQNKTHPALEGKSMRKKVSFVLTKKEVFAAKRKRRISQKQAFGASAEEVLLALGAKIIQKTGKICRHHLAHRQAHSFSGAQERDNLDIATAGANLTAFFTNEDIAAYLIRGQNQDKVKVSLDIKYHETLPLAETITYTLSWGKGRTWKNKIHYFDYRTLKSNEPKVYKALVNTVHTPDEKKIENKAAEVSPIKPLRLFNSGLFHSQESPKPRKRDDEMEERKNNPKKPRI